MHLDAGLDDKHVAVMSPLTRIVMAMLLAYVRLCVDQSANARHIGVGRDQQPQNHQISLALENRGELRHTPSFFVGDLSK
jgi:hypothetical protein